MRDEGVGYKKNELHFKYTPTLLSSLHLLNLKLFTYVDVLVVGLGSMSCKGNNTCKGTWEKVRGRGSPLFISRNKVVSNQNGWDLQVYVP